MTTERFRVSIDHERCQSHGTCAGLAPRVFDLRPEDDRSVALADSFDGALRGDAELAALSCPEMALAVEDA